MSKAIQIGRLLVSSEQQACGAPIFDRATSYDDFGNRFESIVVHLSPWRLDKYGDRQGGLALVLGWRQGPRASLPTPEEK